LIIILLLVEVVRLVDLIVRRRARLCKRRVAVLSPFEKKRVISGGSQQRGQIRKVDTV